MQMTSTKKKPGRWNDKRLVASVHWQAFSTEPRAYLTAAWWRLCGKKLRSHYQFASLFGRSPNAYRLWLIRYGDVRIDVGEGEAGPPIIALIDVEGGHGSLEDTLSSLSAQGVTALPVGTPDMPALNDTSERIDWSEAPWLLPLFAGDSLAPGAIGVYRAAIAGADATTRLAYADDAQLDERGKRDLPHFKPDWNAELFRHFDYLSGACVLRATHEDLEACSASPDWVRRLTQRIAEEGTPLHLPRVLHNRRSRPRPQLPAIPKIGDRELPPVSIIIPTRNRVDLLRTCIDGVEATDYPDVEVIIVDNNSDDSETLAYLANLGSKRYRVLRHAGAFNFSAINNHAVAQARGRLLCLLNNDIEMAGPDWLGIMAMHALREDVGAVGAQLLYPDGRIQHAGIVIGVGNAAGHAHRLLRPEEPGYFRRHALPQFTMAVTAACLVVDRERFLAVGGLDEKNFAVAFNDVDLCLKLNQRGWQSLYEPRATLIHHESVSRGFDRDPVGAARFAKELAALQRIWRTAEVVDPFHHPELNRACEQFVVRL